MPKEKSVPGRLNIINRDSYPMFKPSPVEHHMIERRISSVRVEHISHDEEYEKLKKAGLNIDITNPELLTTAGKRPIDGIFSPLFGADTTQDAPIFACDCHKLTGGENVGRVCPECHQVVRSIEADLRTMGYIDIAPYHIMTFHGYKLFLKKFGKSMMEEILKHTRKLDLKGRMVKDKIPLISELYDSYEDLYEEEFGIPRNVAFTSKIPVYSSRLRPLIHTGVRITMLDVNKHYLSIVTCRNQLITSHVLELDHRLEEQRIINQIQEDFIAILDIVEGLMNHKTGVFRKSLASGRLDFTARMVISIGTDLRPNEVDVPYSFMLEEYEEEIANDLSTLEGISISKAISYIDNNMTVKNKKLYNIINQFLKRKYGVWVLVNRNPSISESSIQYVRIRKVHDDIKDVSLHIPPDITVPMAADFDGDQYTIFCIKDPRFHRLFQPMNSTYAFIDRSNGKFNSGMGFKKDYAAILVSAWDIDSLYDSYLRNPYMDTEEALASLGLSVRPNTDEDRLAERELMREIYSLDPSHPFRKRMTHGFMDEFPF